jgi:hypothetical protein
LTDSLSFKVNSGGGVNRPRPTGQIPQIPTLDQVQLWIGITPDFDLYNLPHKLIGNRTRLYGGVMKPIGSLAKASISHTRNNVDILNNFFDDAWLQQNILNNIPGSASWE